MQTVLEHKQAVKTLSKSWVSAVSDGHDRSFVAVQPQSCGCSFASGCDLLRILALAGSLQGDTHAHQDQSNVPSSPFTRGDRISCDAKLLRHGLMSSWPTFSPARYGLKWACCYLDLQR